MGVCVYIGAIYCLLPVVAIFLYATGGPLCLLLRLGAYVWVLGRGEASQTQRHLLEGAEVSSSSSSSYLFLFAVPLSAVVAVEGEKDGGGVDAVMA